MQAFRFLLLHGFESQARAAFRGVVEIADLMIMVLADEDTYRALRHIVRRWQSQLPALEEASVAGGDPGIDLEA